jgi:DNA mismatch endonuclease (patch repair protein)
LTLDVFTKAKRSEVMSRIRSRGNRDTELALARLLRANGITGWQRHRRVVVEGRKSRVEGKVFPGSRHSSLVSRLTVRPDFVFPKSRTAVFVDGCFWHGCPRHATWPAHRAAWWRRKIEGNKTRDRLVNRALRRSGWHVIRIWECDLRNTERVLKRIKKHLE